MSHIFIYLTSRESMNAQIYLDLYQIHRWNAAYITESVIISE